MVRGVQARRRRRRIRLAALAALTLAVTATVVVAFFTIDVRDPDVPQTEALSYPSYTIGPTPEPTTTTPSNDTVLARFAIAGDIGTRDAHIRKTGEAVAAADAKGRPFDALVVPGDLIYDNGDSALTEKSVIAPFAQTFEVSEIVAAVGNHDIMSNEEKDIMRRLGRPSLTYAAKVGPVRFLVVDSNNVSDEQTDWLAAQLAAPQPVGTVTIPVMHHPAYSSGMHGSTKSIQRKWSPLFAQYKVPLVIAGHDHDYERSKPQNGVTYLVSGGAANLRSVGKDSFSAFSREIYHFVDLSVYPNRLVGRATDQNGNVFDEWAIPLPSASATAEPTTTPTSTPTSPTTENPAA